MLKRYLWIKNIVFLCLFSFLAAQIGNNILLTQIPDSSSPGAFILPQSQKLRKPSVPKTLPFYQVISDRNVFNSDYSGEPAGDGSGNPTDSAGPLKKAELNVLLIGTVVGSPETSFAIIEDQKTKKQELFQLDDIIQDVARVMKISRCKVVVLRDNTEEILECPEEDTGALAKGPRAPAAISSPSGDPSDSVKKVSENEFLIDESEVENSLNNINQLMTQIRVVPNFQDGQTNGFKVFAIKPQSIFSKIGLQNGDVIQRINDQEITTPDKAFQAFNVLRNEKSLSVEILRRGSKKSLSYEIR
jgi:general secretion pathway protein C